MQTAGTAEMKYWNKYVGFMEYGAGLKKALSNGHLFQQKLCTDFFFLETILRLLLKYVSTYEKFVLRNAY